MTTCPYCNIEVSESAIEAEDGCCPECGSVISGPSEFLERELSGDYDDYEDLDDFDEDDFVDDEFADEFIADEFDEEEFEDEEFEEDNDKF